MNINFLESKVEKKYHDPQMQAWIEQSYVWAERTRLVQVCLSTLRIQVRIDEIAYRERHPRKTLVKRAGHI